MARKEIVAAYQGALDALRRGAANGALQMDTKDWVSITVGQKPRTREEMKPFIRRDIASMKPPADWRPLGNSTTKKAAPYPAFKFMTLS
jgi:hypothetical protein